MDWRDGADKLHRIVVVEAFLEGEKGIIMMTPQQEDVICKP